MDPNSETPKPGQPAETGAPAAPGQTMQEKENRGGLLEWLNNWGRPKDATGATVPPAAVPESPPPPAPPMPAETFSPPDVMAGEPKIDNSSIPGQGSGGPTMDAPVAGGVDLNDPVETQSAPPPMPDKTPTFVPEVDATTQGASGPMSTSVEAQAPFEPPAAQEPSTLAPMPDLAAGPLLQPTGPTSVEPTIMPPAPEASPVEAPGATQTSDSSEGTGTL